MKFDELAALTIHDVKNRLALLANHAEARSDSETLRGALQAAASLTHLLVFYKSETGSLGLDIDARVPADLLQELALEIGKQTSLAITVDIAQSPTLWFYDESLVRMVLLNALYNALRYAKQKVHLSAAVGDGCLEFRVTDDGPGYPPEMLENPLATHTMSREGTGLGLHLASRVAAMHQNAGKHGSVELSNADGAVFCLRLPQ